MKQFRGGLVFQAHRLSYHSTLGWRVIKEKNKLHTWQPLHYNYFQPRFPPVRDSVESLKPVQGLLANKDTHRYPSSGDGVKFDSSEVLDRSQGPTVALAT